MGQELEEVEDQGLQIHQGLEEVGVDQELLKHWGLDAHLLQHVQEQSAAQQHSVVVEEPD
jgi:hypothetical protein